jgi:hypothetical protein
VAIIRLLSSYIRSVFESYKDHISPIGLKRVVEFYEEKIIDIASVNSIVAEISKIIPCASIPGYKLIL